MRAGLGGIASLGRHWPRREGCTYRARFPKLGQRAGQRRYLAHQHAIMGRSGNGCSRVKVSTGEGFARCRRKDAMPLRSERRGETRLDDDECGQRQVDGDSRRVDGRGTKTDDACAARSCLGAKPAVPSLDRDEVVSLPREECRWGGIGYRGVSAVCWAAERCVRWPGRQGAK